MQFALVEGRAARHIAIMATSRQSGPLLRDRWPALASAEMAIIAFVLIAIVAVAGGLGYQAHVANRANVETARRALTQYSSVAAWQFARAARREMQSAADATIGARVQHAMRATSGDARRLLSPGELRGATTSDCNCQRPLEVEQFFRWDAGASDITAEREWPEDDRRRLAARFAADAAGTQWPHASSDLLIDVDAMGTPRMLAVSAVHDATRGVRALYGAVISVPNASSVFKRALDRDALLPIVLLPRAAQDSAIAIDVAVGLQAVFTRGALSTADFIATDSLGGGPFGAVVRVGLAPASASRLLIGGLPRSRLPLIGLFLALTLALLVVALRQMRRTSELTRFDRTSCRACRTSCERRSH